MRGGFEFRATLGVLLAAVAGCFGVLLARPDASALPAAQTRPIALVSREGAYHVQPGESIQEAVEAAAADPAVKTVQVHAGTYRPAARGQALVWLNARHDGVRVEAVGEVVLTAANPELADRAALSFPAVVNHVVYLGNGVSRRTVLRGFRITGANDYPADALPLGPPIEPALGSVPALKEHRFFYSDGGAIKIFGRSSPTIERVEIVGNFADPCGGGVSVEQRGFQDDSPLFRSCIFRDNRAAETGSALDVLPHSAVTVEGSLFVGNLSNVGSRRAAGGRGGYTTNYNKEHGSGALTVFPGARALVRRSTFTGNWNGVDDRGAGSEYSDSLLWSNTAAGGIAPQGRYEIDIVDGRGVRGCIIRGGIADLRGSIDRAANRFEAPDPQFDDHFNPRAAAFAGVGYRYETTTAN